MIQILKPKKQNFLLIGENKQQTQIGIGYPIYGPNKSILSARLGFGHYSIKELEQIIKAIKYEEKRRKID